MTTDPFTEAASEEACARYLIDADHPGPTELAYCEVFEFGAEWARAHLAAQEPTDAEVEAVASSILLSTSGRQWEDIDEGERREYRRYARAALIRARAARRNEENLGDAQAYHFPAPLDYLNDDRRDEETW